MSRKRSMKLSALLPVFLFFCSCQTQGANSASVPAKKTPLSSSAAAGAFDSSEERSDNERAANYRRALLLVQTMEMLQKNYVDGKKVTYEELFNHAMRGMVSALDPYSDYEPPREFRHQQVRRTGAVVGIGAAAVKPDGRPITLIRILPGTPAARGKLRPGDQITAIDDHPVFKLNLARALDKLRGAPGTRVKLQIKRGKKEFFITLKREHVRANSIVPGSVKLIEGRIGYLKLTSFTANSPKEFKDALLKLKAIGAQALILDLRYNPGGLVDAAVNIASMVLAPEKVVFRARSRNKNFEQTVRTRKNLSFDTTTPLIILANGYSASCSEILSGALQDHKRARVLGVRTFGKGTILRVVPMTGGGAVRYASSYYVTPGGRTIEKKGIIPDIEVRLTPAEVLHLSSQTLHYPGVITPSHKGTIQDRQLSKAVEVLRRELEKKAAAL